MASCNGKRFGHVVSGVRCGSSILRCKKCGNTGCRVDDCSQQAFSNQGCARCGAASNYITKLNNGAEEVQSAGGFLGLIFLAAVGYGIYVLASWVSGLFGEGPNMNASDNRSTQIQSVRDATDFDAADISERDFERGARGNAVDSRESMALEIHRAQANNTTAPRIISRATPRYPRQLIRRGIEGEVTLRFDLNNNGEVVNIRVIESQPSGVFDRAATDALIRFRYEPAKNSGVAVYSRDHDLTFEFKIED